MLYCELTHIVYSSSRHHHDKSMLQGVGFEPTQSFDYQILSLTP